jgi:hypothetical protein
MDRTAEEFVHQLPGDRWFVGDFVRTDESGEGIVLVEMGRSALGREMAVRTILALSRISRSHRVRTYAHKSSAKRAAQQMIERVLGEEGP